MKPRVRLVAAGRVAANLIAEGDRIVGSIESGKPFEPETLEAWHDLCAHGGTVVDVGAYTGLFSIIAAKLGCHVLAFEPLAANRARCRENAERNRVSFGINSEAVTDKVGKAEIVVNPNVKGLTSGASLIRQSGLRVRVPTTSIDALQLAAIVAMKIDVERAEPMVLRGARATLKRCRPALIVEVLDDERKDEVLAAVRGYRIEATLDQRNWLMLPC